MFCPVCKAEFREGFDRCNECQVNLVEDLTQICEPIEGEFKLCTTCEQEFPQDQAKCAECGMKLRRAVLRDDTYFFLDQPDDVSDVDFSEEFEPEMITELEFYEDMSEREAAILLESENIDLLVRIQELLNQEQIHFQFVPAQKDPTTLGGILGAGNPLERSFPKVLVRAEDEEKAVQLIAEHPALGLLEIPEELLEAEDDDEDDYDDFADLVEDESDDELADEPEDEE